MENLRLNLFSPDSVQDLIHAGCSKIQMGNPKGALDDFVKGQAMLDADGDVESTVGASVMVGIGSARLAMADHEGAAEAYAEVRRICLAVGALECADGLSALTALGNIRHMQGCSPKALEAWCEARCVREAMGLLECPAGASLLTNIGIVRRMTGDLEGATAAYEEARRLHFASAPPTPVVGMTLADSTWVGGGQGGYGGYGGHGGYGSYGGYGPVHAPVVNLAKLLTETPRRIPNKVIEVQQLDAKVLELMAASHVEEKDMMQATQTLDTPHGAEVMLNLGIVRRLQGDLKGAAACYREATQTLDTPRGAEVMLNLGIVRRLQGDLEGAAACYREARRIDSATNPQAAMRPTTPSMAMPGSRPGTAPRHGASTMLRPMSSAGGTPLLDSPLECQEDEVMMPRNLAAGSPLQAARQAKRLEAKLERTRAEPSRIAER